MRVAVLDLKEPPVVGRMYLVPCVRVEEHGNLFVPQGWVPVTGPKHEDMEHVGFPWAHWHYDFRFLADRQLRVLSKHTYGHVLGAVRFNLEHTAIPEVGSAPELRRMKCRRELPPYPHREVEQAWGPGLRAACADKVVTCGKCPHRGLPLESLPREPGTNVVTCPGHGLRWDLATGRLVQPGRGGAEG